MGALAITDRGYRYRANNAIPEHPKVCAFCGARPQQVKLMVAHLDGHEENTAPDNLSWSCRPCNTVASNTLKNAGLGRATRQFNPTKGGGAANVGEWIQAVGAIHPRVQSGKREGQFETKPRNADLSSSMSVSDAVAMIRATPHHKRSQFAAQLRKHAGARAAAHYNPTKQNLWPFSDGRKHGTTPAHGGLAAHMKKGTAKPKAGEGGEVGSYKGYRISKTASGEFFSSLDRDSWYDTAAQVRRAIDSYLKGRGNPAMKRTQDISRIPPKGLSIYRDEEALKLGKGAASATVVPVHGDRDFKWRKVGSDGGQDYFRTHDEALHFIQHHYYDWIVGLHNPADALDRFNDLQKQGFMKQGRGKAKTLYRAMTPHGATYTGPDKHTAEAHVRQYGGKVEKVSRRNPAAAAAEGYKEFHGHAPTEVVTVVKKVHFHEHLSGAGKLKKLVIKGIDFRTTGRIVTLQKFGGALLAFNEAKNQLFIEGGDQSVNLSDFGIDLNRAHELETLGRVTNIDYDTNKTHLGKEGGRATYEHGFRMTNENGEHIVVKIARYPDLIYSVPDEQLLFSGGSYFIRAEGIDQ